MAAITRPYLGQPGAMRRLPAPRGPVTAAPDRGETKTTLLSGNVAVSRGLNAKRSYSIPYEEMGADDADTILNFYRGVYGEGWFRLVDPSFRNMLGVDVSTFGVRSVAAIGWAASGGTLTKSTSPPPLAPDSGVAAWAATAGAKVTPGSLAGFADVKTAPVYLPLEPVTVSLWVKVSANSTLTLTLTPFDSAGATIAGGPTTSVAATAAQGWQRLVVTAAAGASALAAGYYVLPALVSSAAVTVSLAGGQVEYADVVSKFQVGGGCPRVTITDPPGREVPVIGFSSHTLLLAEG
jgi:hypothetical protein